LEKEGKGDGKKVFGGKIGQKGRTGLWEEVSMSVNRRDRCEAKGEVVSPTWPWGGRGGGRGRWTEWL